jgi:glycosyltransferase involved in cell wall biosynthesis
LLQGLRNQSVRDVEVVVVDSGSTDSTVAIAQSHNAKVVHVPAKDFTFGRSLNAGIRAAFGDSIVIASAHVYPVYPDWLETLLAPFQDPAVALTYGKQRAPESARFSERQVFLQWYPDTSVPRQGTAFCNNANAAIRRSLWERHAYDEDLTGLEDLAWAQWAREQGHVIEYVAEAEVIHVHSESPRGVLNRYRREAMAFRRIHPEAHFSLYDFGRLSIVNIANDGWHALRAGVILRHLPGIVMFRLMQFLGTWTGYRESGLLTPQLRETFYYPRRGASRRGSQREVRPIEYQEHD